MLVASPAACSRFRLCSCQTRPRTSHLASVLRFVEQLLQILLPHGSMRVCAVAVCLERRRNQDEPAVLYELDLLLGDSKLGRLMKSSAELIHITGAVIFSSCDEGS